MKEYVLHETCELYGTALLERFVDGRLVSVEHVRPAKLDQALNWLKENGWVRTGTERRIYLRGHGIVLKAA